MIIVLAEHQKGEFKKAAFETVFYGAKMAELTGTKCVALVLGQAQKAGDLGQYGASEVVHIDDAKLNSVDTQVYAKVIKQVFEQKGGQAMILSHSSTGKSLAGRLGIALDAATVTATNSLPSFEQGVQVTRPVFAGKAVATYTLEGDRKVISLMGNSLQPQVIGESVEVQVMTIDIPDSKIEVKEVKVADGIVPLPEAELVVSAGRGMKGPENWGIIEELADVLGATTACSRPVADADWRPHHEHVGQTGIAIRPNLYIAIGISGAIQHLAGVNSSKVIVVINKDPEAPFFKAADYGVVADLFDVVPKLTEAIKKYRS